MCSVKAATKYLLKYGLGASQEGGRGTNREGPQALNMVTRSRPNSGEEVTPSPAHLGHAAPPWATLTEALPCRERHWGVWGGRGKVKVCLLKSPLSHAGWDSQSGSLACWPAQDRTASKEQDLQSLLESTERSPRLILQNPKDYSFDHSVK